MSAYQKIYLWMFEPADRKITAIEAKKAYRAIMLKIGYYTDKTREGRVELAESIRYFGEAMKLELEDKRGAYLVDKDDCIPNIRDNFYSLRELKQVLKECKDCPEQHEIEQDIAQVSRWIERDRTKLEESKKAYQLLKSDWRYFLIEYINKETGNE